MPGECGWNPLCYIGKAGESMLNAGNKVVDAVSSNAAAEEDSSTESVSLNVSVDKLSLSKTQKLENFMQSFPFIKKSDLSVSNSDDGMVVNIGDRSIDGLQNVFDASNEVDLGFKQWITGRILEDFYSITIPQLEMGDNDNNITSFIRNLPPIVAGGPTLVFDETNLSGNDSLSIAKIIKHFRGQQTTAGTSTLIRYTVRKSTDGNWEYSDSSTEEVNWKDITNEVSKIENVVAPTQQSVPPVQNQFDPSTAVFQLIDERLGDGDGTISKNEEAAFDATVKSYAQAMGISKEVAYEIYKNHQGDWEQKSIAQLQASAASIKDAEILGSAKDAFDLLKTIPDNPSTALTIQRMVLLKDLSPEGQKTALLAMGVKEENVAEIIVALGQLQPIPTISDAALKGWLGGKSPVVTQDPVVQGEGDELAKLKKSYEKHHADGNIDGQINDLQALSKLSGMPEENRSAILETIKALKAQQVADALPDKAVKPLADASFPIDEAKVVDVQKKGFLLTLDPSDVFYIEASDISGQNLLSRAGNRVTQTAPGIAVVKKITIGSNTYYNFRSPFRNDTNDSYWVKKAGKDILIRKKASNTSPPAKPQTVKISDSTQAEPVNSTFTVSKSNGHPSITDKSLKSGESLVGKHVEIKFTVPATDSGATSTMVMKRTVAEHNLDEGTIVLKRKFGLQSYPITSITVAKG